ncbi:MAG: histidine--tRNA ligase [Actinomycetota bacterium]|nr:histidine--tRNA ligase [Actinomycetota bacterium]
MARPLFQALPGTRDLLPPDTDRMRELVSRFAERAITAGFGLVVPPMFEDIGVFVRLGEASDVVSKELYDFEDKGGRHIALRPEQTASVCRIYAEARPTTPWKAWYAGPNFRYDKPQAGRYRQFDQVGAEVIGSHDPDVDVELIALAARFFRDIGLTRVRLLLNSLGDGADRPRYLDALRAHFESDVGALSEQSRLTLAKNPLRVLDSKRPQDLELVASAPVIVDYLSDDAGAAFERVQAGLTVLGVEFELAPRLVRGLDYYTRTTFEFAADGLESAQNAVGGGGRYDGLIADLGGPPDPGVGFALGVDRTLLACDAESAFSGPDTRIEVWIVATTGGFEATELADELRAHGIRTDRSFDGRSMKAQMKGADRSGASLALIVGADEAAAGMVSIRSLREQGAQQSLVPRSDLVTKVKEMLER